MKKLIFLCSLFITFKSTSQVLINPSGSGTPHPNAILELRDTTKGFLLPNVSETTMNSLSMTAPNGLLLFNKDINIPYYFNQPLLQWRQLSSDTSMWKLNAGENRLYFKPALSLSDSIFYNYKNRSFIYSDNFSYKNSFGIDFNVDRLGGKYIFKGTSSRADTAYKKVNMLVVSELDNYTANDPFNLPFRNVSIATTLNPQNNSKDAFILGLESVISNGSVDSVESLTASRSVIFNRPESGYVNSITATQNLISLNGKHDKNLGRLTGNSILITSDTFNNYSIANVVGNDINITANILKKANGSVFGQRLFATLGIPRNNNKIYGLFHGNIGIEEGNALNNFSLYTNSGNNRLGDSTLITKNTGFILPRAILDINSNESIIIPVGDSISRPTSLIIGQLRYSTTEKQLEFYNGIDWAGIRSLTVSINLNIPDSSGVTISVPFPGIKIGDVVVVNPETILPSGIVISWANVNSINFVNLRVDNNSSTSLTGARNFRIKAIR